MNSKVDNAMFSVIKLPRLGEPGDRFVAAKIKKLLKPNTPILITGHERPDGDCIGSEIALCSILRCAGYQAVIVNTEPIPARYQFLDSQGWARVVAMDECLEAAVIFVLDASDLTRLGRIKIQRSSQATIIALDHHPDNLCFGDINWIDRKAAATGELIWRLAACCGWHAPPLAMDALYIALLTDTGQFSYANTTPRAMRMAAHLIESGVDPEQMWRRVYLNKPPEELALETCARANLEFFADGRICSIALRYADFHDTCTSPANTEQFVQIPRSVAGVEMALFFYEINEGRETKVSIRTTRRLDASALAHRFGGGGHRQAAGCSLPVPLVQAKKKFLAEAVRVVKKR
ncbi:MAG: bifunctional oligoribonuclease/PAP phosphatase NrnA [Planctomycetota bacterium]